MPFVWLMDWEGITPQQYEALREGVGWETDVPDGLHFHVAAFDENGLIVTEVWESPDHVQPYMDGRFLPMVRQLGIETMPKVDLYPTHRLFVPGRAQPG